MTIKLFQVILLHLIWIFTVNSIDIQYNLSAYAVLDKNNNFNLSLSIFPTKGTISINITGPDSKWFGIGFGNTVMTNTYAIICSKDTSSKSICQENKLSNPGTTGFGQQLTQTITVTHDNTQNQTRTVYITRNITINDPNYFSFPTSTTSINIIYAIGNSDTFSSTTSSMGPGGSTALLIQNTITNNLTTNTTLCGAKITLNEIIIYPEQDIVQLNLSGPSNVWFGIGFNSSLMGPDTYAIVCDHITCHENHITTTQYGNALTSTIDVAYNESINGRKNVIINRKRNITASDSTDFTKYFEFPVRTTTIPIIYAIGQSNTWSSTDSMSFNSSTFGTTNIVFSNETKRYNLTASLSIFPSVNQSISISVSPDDNEVEIIFTGPSNVWYGIGFNSQRMNNTYAIVIDSANSAHEYILGEGTPGNRIGTNIQIVDNTVIHGMRNIKITRAISVRNTNVYDFPVIPCNVPIISAYGTRYPYNASNMSDATVATLRFTSSNGNTTNDTMCKPGVISYGTEGNVDNGLTVGLYIYCDSNTIQLSIDYTDYSPNWFGIVFNTMMTPSPNATVFTTGKPTETQRPLQLYAYDLGAHDMSEVVYHKERDWTQIKQSVMDSKVSIVYEQELSNTKWNIFTKTISFRYAWGTAAQGTELQQHEANSYSKVWQFNLETGSISASGSNVLQIAHGIIMILSWSILTTVSIFSSRYRLILYQKVENKAMWFFVHRGVQSIVVVLILIGFSIAVYFTQKDDNQHFSNLHEYFGLTVVILAVLQPLNAWFRPHPPKMEEDKSVGRLLWEIVHKSCGYSVWILAQIAIYLGIGQLTSKTIYQTVLIAWVGFIVFVYICLWIYSVFCFNPPISNESEKPLLSNALDADTLQRNVSPNQNSIGPATTESNSD